MAKTFVAVERESISILELFGGIGACTKALKNIGMNVDVVDYVEIDKYAVKSYNAINDTNFEPQDITKWNKDIKVDLIMHGSPCQDISIAGLQAGADKDTGTRSSLMYETIRIVEKLNPKYVIWENVKNLLSKKHKHNFDNYIDKLEKLGYNSYYQVLNAKDYGIPQNRERVYTISIRKDIDNGNFKFPEKEELKMRLKDILEDKVDEKYYLKDYQLENIKKSNYIQNQRRIQEKDYCDTLCARDWKDPKCVRVGGIFDTENSKHQAGSIYDKDGLAPTLTTQEEKIITNYRIRKLTPLECWRLMGFDDKDFDRAEKVNSNTQLYKQARKFYRCKCIRKNIFKFIKGELNGSQRKN